MGWQWVYTNDDTDENAERGGSLTFAEAGRRLGRSATFVKARIEQGLLRTVTFAGRTYVDAASVASLLQSAGYGPSVEERCIELERQGRGSEASRIRELAHREAHPDQYEEQAQDYFASSRAVDTDDFLRRFGRG